jgi:hypothetical protein
MLFGSSRSIDSTGNGWLSFLPLPNRKPSKAAQADLTRRCEPAAGAPALYPKDRRAPVSIDPGKSVVQPQSNPSRRNQGVLIVGTGPVAQDVRNYLTSLPRATYDFRGFAGTPQQIFQTRASDAERIANADDLIALARARFVDEIIFTTRPSPELESELLSEAAPHHIHIRYIPGVSETLRTPDAIRYIGNLPTILMHQPLARPLSTFLKRCIDITLTVAALILLAPLFALIAIAVRLDTAGPIFYASPRRRASSSIAGSSAPWCRTPQRCCTLWPISTSATASSSRSPKTRASPGSARSCVNTPSTSFRSCGTYCTAI